MAYSTDLRTRAVKHFLSTNQSYQSAASLFQIGVGTFHRWVKRYRTTGNIDIRKSSGRPRCLNPAAENEFKAFVLQHSDATLSTLSDKWAKKTGVTLSIFCISRTLRRMNFTNKKNISRSRTRQ
jgi:transposase